MYRTFTLQDTLDQGLYFTVGEVQAEFTFAEGARSYNMATAPREQTRADPNQPRIATSYSFPERSADRHRHRDHGCRVPGP